MRIIAMTNEGQLPMMKNMLNSASKSGWPMDLFHCYVLSSNKEVAAYYTQEFQSITLRKLEVILENMRIDSEVLWIDNDIYLFENAIQHMRSFQGDFVMQDDLWGPCTGFFLVRSTPASIRAIEKTIQVVRLQIGKNTFNDQQVFLKIYKNIWRLRVTLLPQELYPNGHVYFDKEIQSTAKMVHNNYLTTTDEKVTRFKNHNLWDESDSGFLQTKRYSI